MTAKKTNSKTRRQRTRAVSPQRPPLYGVKFKVQEPMDPHRPQRSAFLFGVLPPPRIREGTDVLDTLEDLRRAVQTARELLPWSHEAEDHEAVVESLESVGGLLLDIDATLTIVDIALRHGEVLHTADVGGRGRFGLRKGLERVARRGTATEGPMAAVSFMLNCLQHGERRRELR